jgi:hypothetical protein
LLNAETLNAETPNAETPNAETLKPGGAAASSLHLSAFSVFRFSVSVF